MADSSEAPRSTESPSASKAATPVRSNPGSPKSKTASPRSKTASPQDPSSPEVRQDAAEIEAEDIDSFLHGGNPVTDDQLSSYTASLSSSVVDYPVEHGRTYHAFRSGAYYAPNDEGELDRLDFLSTLVFRVIGQPYLAPIEKHKVQRILDIGTGTGIWACEIGEELPHAEVIGNDLSPSQTIWVPPNVKFEVDDVESPWISKKFDFIFCRAMAGAIQDWPKLARSMFEHTNSGGWVEFQDWDLLYRSDDGTITDNHESLRMVKIFIDVCRQIGREACPGPLQEQLARDAGFVNIVHQKFKVPIGPWAKDPYYKDIGTMNLICVLEGLEAFYLRLLTGVLGWSREEVLVTLATVRNELKSGIFHAHMEFHVTYAQKP